MPEPIARPGDADPCGSCRHTFGQHYTTYNGLTGGCSYLSYEERAGDFHCACTGFALVILWGPQ